jgi:beta-glucosidase
LSEDTKCIAVIGDNSTIAGTGSGRVQPAYVITPEQGIENALKEAGLSSVTVQYNDGSDIDSATALASSCDVAVVNVATTCGEGNDRETLALGDGQDELVQAILAANPRTVVSVVAPGPVLMPWSKQVPAVLMSWLPGQEAGNALADVLFGKLSPSARLHVTMPNKDNEVAFTREQYPGVGFPHPIATYSEGLFVGYRYYEANYITPNFCFGHGLSYTSFKYDDVQQVQVTKKSSNAGVLVHLSVDITNTGTVDSNEVAQLYVSYPSSLAEEPAKQLKSFQKVLIKASETATVVFELTERDLSIWNTDKHAWELVNGTFEAVVGASSCTTGNALKFEIA